MSDKQPRVTVFGAAGNMLFKLVCTIRTNLTQNLWSNLITGAQCCRVGVFYSSAEYKLTLRFNFN